MFLQTHEGSPQLNGILITTGLREMIEGKYYKALELVFPFVFGYADAWMGLQDDDILTNIHALYNSMGKQLLPNSYCIGWLTKDVDEMMS